MYGATLWQGQGDVRSLAYPSLQFLPGLWELGVMLLEEQPIVIKRWVKLSVNGNTEWKKTVPKGAERRRNTQVKERECCHGG